MFTAVFVCRTIFETVLSLKRMTKLSI
jgi:hypothetical protein